MPPMPPMPEAGASKKQAASEAPFPMAHETADAPYEIRLRLSRSLISMIPFRRKPCRRIFPS